MSWRSLRGQPILDETCAHFAQRAVLDPIYELTQAESPVGVSVVAGTKLGKYEIVKHLATGGMAELLIARTRGLVGFERHVVVKRIRDDHEDRVFVDMFLNEASLAALLHHHNIVQVLDIGEEEGKPYFVMEYVHGEDLRTLLHSLFMRKQLMPIEHVVSIVATIAIALHHAHEQRSACREPLGIVHRDVTPGNIIVGYDGNVKVVDFGIAKAAMRKVVTQAGMRKGKAPYMSPEQCRGVTVDRRSDIFALGIVLHETVTGRRLFKAPNDYATMSAVVDAEIPIPSKLRSEIPPALDAIVMRALQRDPGARFQTAEAMVRELEAFSLAAGLRASSLGLAQYMTSVFGTRVEPWLVDHTPPHATQIDFDDTRVDTEVTPIEEVSVQAAKKPGLPKPRPPAAKSTLPSVLAKPDISPVVDAGPTVIVAVPAPTPPPTPTTVATKAEVVAAAPLDAEVDTDVSDLPPIEPLPPPPPRPTLAAADTTAIVKPLPSPLVTDARRAKRASTAPEQRHAPTDIAIVPVEQIAIDTAPIARPRGRTKIVVGAVGAVAVVVAVVFAIGFGGRDAATEPPPAAPIKPVAAAAPAPDPVEGAPRPPRTWANSEKPPEIAAQQPAAAPAPENDIEMAAAADPATNTDPASAATNTEPAVAKAVPPPKTELAVAKATAAKPAVAKPAVAKVVTRAKVPAKRTTKAAPAKPAANWNPNSLFPSK